MWKVLKGWFQALFAEDRSGLSYEARLRKICMGDQEAVERLINLERKQHPGLSLAEACRRAIERYKRDNR